MNPSFDLDGGAEARTWMLPLLRSHVYGARLGYWGTALLPLARDMGNRAAAARAAGSRVRALQCAALEAQLWQALPAFASYALDGGEALRRGREFGVLGGWHGRVAGAWGRGPTTRNARVVVEIRAGHPARADTPVFVTTTEAHGGRRGGVGGGGSRHASALFLTPAPPPRTPSVLVF